MALYSSSEPYLISLPPLPNAWGLHTNEGEWVPADNNQPNQQQFEDRQEGGNVSEEIKKPSFSTIIKPHIYSGKWDISMKQVNLTGIQNN